MLTAAYLAAIAAAASKQMIHHGLFGDPRCSYCGRKRTPPQGNTATCAGCGAPR